MDTSERASHIQNNTISLPSASDMTKRNKKQSKSEKTAESDSFPISKPLQSHTEGYINTSYSTAVPVASNSQAPSAWIDELTHHPKPLQHEQPVRPGIHGDTLEDVQRKGKFPAAQARAEESMYETKKAIRDTDGNDSGLLHFKDALGRKFRFPFHLVNTWQVSHLVTWHLFSILEKFGYIEEPPSPPLSKAVWVVLKTNTEKGH